MASLSSNFIVNVQGQYTNLASYVRYQTNTVVQFSAAEPTVSKYAATFEQKTIIRQSDILAEMDGVPLNGAQMYTFGPYQRPLGIATCISGNNFAFSTDFVNWSNNFSGVFNGSNTFAGYSVLYNGIIWVAGGQSTGTNANTLAYSYNGHTWTGLGASVFGTAVKGLEWNGQIWVANGCGSGNALAYSYDGIKWTGVGNVIINNPDDAGTVKWNGQVFLACGYTYGANALAYSTDGKTWTGVNVRSTIVRVRDAVWTGTYWIATGSGGNSHIYTLDPTGASGWTAIGAIFNTAGTSIDWNGQILVSAGQATPTLAFTFKNPISSANWQTYAPTAVANAPFTTYMQAIKWTGQRWIGVGLGGNTIGYSLFGNLWNGYGRFNMGTSVYPSAVAVNNTRPHSITFQRNIYVAGGNGTTNTMAYSYDGQTWTGLGKPIFQGECSGIEYNGTVWVASGTTGNTIAVSKDGLTWQGLGTKVIENNGMWTTWIPLSKTWLVGGTGQPNGNILAASMDGYTWQGVSQILQTIPATSVLYKVEAGLDKLVAVSDNAAGNTLAYTTDLTGETGWIGLGHTIFTVRGRHVKWNGQMWVAGGQGTNSLAYSYDGIKWTGIATSIVTNVYQVEWNGQMWVAVGVLSGGTSTTMYSYDGITWNSSTNVFTTGALSVKWVGNKWIVCGWGANGIAVSGDGINWKSVSAIGSIFTNYGYAVGWSAGKPNVYIQQQTILGGLVPGNTLAYSMDGQQWTGLGTTVFSARCNGLGWNGYRWIACGSSRGVVNANTMAHSLDGITWTGLGTSVFSTEAYGVSWNGQLWVSLGSSTGSPSSGPFAWSKDGVTWYNSGQNSSIIPRTTQWNGTYWLAGGSGSNSLAYSLNGKTWTAVSGSSAMMGECRTIATNGYMWVIGGGQGGTAGIAYTYDITGQTQWTAIANQAMFSNSGTSGVKTICWNGQIWLAGGTGEQGNTMAYSYDGLTWSPLGEPVFSTTTNSICWNGTKFIATGQDAYGNTVAVSSDGINWSSSAVNGNTVIPVAGNIVCSNPQMGSYPVDSTIVLNSAYNSLQPTADLEFVSAPYNQPGFENVVIRTNALNVY